MHISYYDSTNDDLKYATTTEKTDLIVDFSSGIWTRYSDITWTLLHSLDPETIATGDMDGSDRDEVIIDFGTGIGIWTRYNNSSWTQHHSSGSEAITTGDLDGSNKDEVVIDFGAGAGIWVRYDDVSWTNLHSLSPEIIAAGDSDGI